MKLKDNVIIITGSSSEIGEVTAFKLSENGAKIVLSVRREDKLHEVKNTITDEDILNQLSGMKNMTALETVDIAEAIY